MELPTSPDREHVPPRSLTHIAEAPVLSPARAFVVHVHPPHGGGVCAGRAEHVRSGRVLHFGTWQELAAFAAAVIAEEENPS